MIIACQIRNSSNEYKIIGDELYQITIDSNNSQNAIYWCEERFGKSIWLQKDKFRWEASNERWGFVGKSEFAFANESDYMEFCLRWE